MSALPPGYDPAPPKPAELAPAAFEMQYLQAFSYITENPNWAANVGWGVLLFMSQYLVPLVGPVMLLGYQFDITESLCRTRGTRYPDFTFDRLGDYLMRGLWPVLASLVGGLMLMALLVPFIVGGIALFVVGIGSSAQQGNGPGGDLGPILAMCGMGLVGFLAILVYLVGALYITPMVVRAGLTQDFGQAFQFGWTRDFVAKTWFEMILTMLFIAASMIALGLAGLLMCGIGLLFMPVIGQFAQAHLYYQLYMLYLSRGGEPIPLKAPPSPPMKPSFPPQ